MIREDGGDGLGGGDGGFGGGTTHEFPRGTDGSLQHSPPGVICPGKHGAGSGGGISHVSSAALGFVPCGQQMGCVAFLMIRAGSQHSRAFSLFAAVRQHCPLCCAEPPGVKPPGQTIGLGFSSHLMILHTPSIASFVQPLPTGLLPQQLMKSRHLPAAKSMLQSISPPGRSGSGPTGDSSGDGCRCSVASRPAPCWMTCVSS
jgi:hypothetical protein